MPVDVFAKKPGQQ